MSKKPRDNRPYIRPVTRVELSETNIRLRWIAIAVCLSVAVVAIGYGFSLALSTEPGWQEVKPLSQEVNCGGDFVLMYDFGVGDVNPTAQYKKLETLYGELTVSAYRLFSPEAEGTDNLYYLNRHANESVSVNPALYRALEQIAASDSRHAYMGPVQELYDPVFLSAGDAEAALYDPMKDETLADLARETASYCADPEMIDLELLGDNQVRLNVARDYLEFAEEYGIEVFLDLGWMTNAFIIDYMADALEAEGHTFGYLASYDGFTRNLDISGKLYSVDISNRIGNDIYIPVRMDYAGKCSIVTLRDYPMSGRDQWHYYAYETGEITTAFVDPGDGRSKSSIDGLTAYSRDQGCAQILLSVSPVFIADSFDAYPLEVLAREGVHSIRCYDRSVVCTDEAVQLTLLDPSYSFMISRME